MEYLHQNCTLQGSGIYVEDKVERVQELEVRDDSRETASSRHMADTHMNSQIVAVCIGPAHVQARQNPSMPKGKWTQGPTPS